MRFTGRLHTHENLEGPGLAVEFELDAEYLTVSSEARFIGRYLLAEIEARGEAHDRFELSIGDDHLVFSPVDSALFRSLGLPAFGKQPDRPRSVKRLVRSLLSGAEATEVVANGARADSGSEPEAVAGEGSELSGPAAADACGVTQPEAAEPDAAGGWEARVEEIRRELSIARGATESAFDGFFDLSPTNGPEPEGPRFCAGVDESGLPCSLAVVSATGYCSTHDPHGLSDPGLTESGNGVGGVPVFERNDAVRQNSVGDRSPQEPSESASPAPAVIDWYESPLEPAGMGPMQVEMPELVGSEVEAPWEGEATEVEPVEPEVPNAEPAGVEPVDVERWDGEAAEVEGVEVEPADVEASEVKRVAVERWDGKAAEVEPWDGEAAEVEPWDGEAAEVEPVEPEVPNAEPAGVEPVDAERWDGEAAEVEGVEVEPVEPEVPNAQPAGAEQLEVKPWDGEAAEVEPVEPEVPNAEPAGAEPVDVEASEVEPLEIRAAEPEPSEPEQSEPDLTEDLPDSPTLEPDPIAVGVPEQPIPGFDSSDPWSLEQERPAGEPLESGSGKGSEVTEESDESEAAGEVQAVRHGDVDGELATATVDAGTSPGEESDIDWVSLAKRLVDAVEQLDERRMMPDEAMALAALAEAACRVIGMKRNGGGGTDR